jgi:competence protein ComEA
MWETIRGYLTFTKKERLGVLFLLLVISALFVFPFFFKRTVGSPDPSVGKKYFDGIRRLEKSENDSSKSAYTGPGYATESHLDNRAKKYSGSSFTGEMFFFDPNSTGAAEWKSLGLNDHLIQTILHFVAKGGHFYKPADLVKLYGLHDADYRRLLPYVRIRKPPDVDPVGFQKSKPRYETPKYLEKKLISTDINLADSADWCRLPGIGAKLASRIVHFRERLGGFYAIDQVGETFGLPDSGFQKIKSCLRLNPGDIHQIDLNHAAKEILLSHPYIRWQIANAILDYRVQHGGFKSVDELQQLARMDTEKYQRIRPYLTIKP